MAQPVMRLRPETADMIRSTARHLAVELSRTVTQDQVVRAAMIVADHYPEQYRDAVAGLAET